jgi:hypothetical protein
MFNSSIYSQISDLLISDVDYECELLVTVCQVTCLEHQEIAENIIFHR